MYVCTQVEELVAKLPSLERVVVLGMTGDDPSWDELGDLVISWEDFLASGNPYPYPYP